MRSACLCLTVLFSLSAFHLPPCHAQTESSSAQAVEEAINAALDKPIDWEYIGDPFEEVIKDLEKRTGVTFLVDKHAIDEAGFGMDAPIEFRAKALPLRYGLNIALEQHELTWCIADDAITITTPNAAESRLVQRVYNVPAKGDGKRPYDFDTLIDIISITILPESWSDAGGPGTIEVFGGTIVISQTQTVHDQVAELLKTIGEMNAGQIKSSSAGIESGERALRSVLNQHVTLPSSETILSEFAELLTNTLHINVILDRRSLDDAGVAVDAPVSVKANDIPLRVLLSRSLQPLDLTWTLHEGVLSICTADKAESKLAVRIYRLDGLGIEQHRGGARFDTDGLPLAENDALESLVDVIQNTVSPDSWAQAGGPGDCQTIPQLGLLVVSQVEKVHEQTEALLSQLRRALAEQNAENGSSISKAADGGLAPGAITARVDSPSGPPQMQFLVHQIPLNKNHQPIYPAEDLKRVIMMAVEPDSWSKSDDVLIEAIGNGIAIRHNEAIQNRVSRLLRHISMSASQIQIPTGGGFGGGGGGGGFFQVPELSPVR